MAKAKAKAGAAAMAAAASAGMKVDHIEDEAAPSKKIMHEDRETAEQKALRCIKQRHPTWSRAKIQGRKGKNGIRMAGPVHI